MGQASFYASSFNNSTPKPPKTIEEENEDVLALPIIENPKPVSLLTDYNHSSTVSDNVLQSSLSDTATLIHDSDLILNGHNNTDLDDNNSTLELAVDSCHSLQDDCAGRISLSEDKKTNNLNSYSDLKQGKVTDVRIWDLTLAQLAEAKAWSHHSLTQVCESPDLNLGKVLIGESGEVPGSLISQCKEMATEYLVKNKKSTASGVIINETCNGVAHGVYFP